MPNPPTLTEHHPHLPHWVIILLLLFVPPVGWWHMWRNHRYHSWFPYVLWLNAAMTLGFSAYVIVHYYLLLTSLFNPATYIFFSHIILLLFSAFEIGFGFYLVEKFKNEAILRRRTLAVVIILLFMNTITIPLSQLIIKAYVENRAKSFTTATKVQNASPIAKWKMYTNPSMEFSIKYPQNWRVVDLENRFEYPEDRIEPVDNQCQKSPDCEPVFDSLYISVKDNPNNLSIESFNSGLERPEEGMKFTYTKRTVNGLDALETTIPCADICPHVFIVNAKKIFDIELPRTGAPNFVNKTSQEIADQILSTFRFTN